MCAYIGNSCIETVKAVLANSRPALSSTKSLTHRGDHVSGGALVLREPESCQLGGGEDDEGLSQGTKGLTQHHCIELVCMIIARGGHCPNETHQASEHVQPGSQNHLQSRDGIRSKCCNEFNTKFKNHLPLVVVVIKNKPQIPLFELAHTERDLPVKN